jgi:hypothetical protein
VALAAWERSKQKLRRYIRRRPEESVLYRIIHHYRDDFEYRWEELFQQHYGALRSEVLDAFDRYLSCGILAHGCARARCERCNHSILIAFSCKRRCLCPSCDTKRSLLFAEHLQSHVLRAFPHRHVVWSIPKRLRVYFRYDRELTKCLYTAAWTAWKESVSERLSDGKPGAVMALHTAGDLLNFHPHVHALCLDGAIDAGGVFHQLPPPDVQLLERRFAEHIFRFLRDAELLSRDVIDSMRSWEHSGFNVFVAESTPADATDARLFLARYLKRSPLSLERMSLIETGPEPKIRLVKKLDDGETHRDLSPLEFLAELQQHIPDTWEQTTRYFGAYASRTRGKERREREWNQNQNPAPPARSNGDDKPSDPVVEATPKASRTWAAAIKRIYEVDPLVCERCGGQMKIIAFLHQPKEIEKLCDNLGYPRYRAPPPFVGRPASAERTVAPLSDDWQPAP